MTPWTQSTDLSIILAMINQSVTNLIINQKKGISFQNLQGSQKIYSQQKGSKRDRFLKKKKDKNDQSAFSDLMLNSFGSSITDLKNFTNMEILRCLK